MFHQVLLPSSQPGLLFCSKRETAWDEKKVASSCFFQDVCHTALPQPGDRALLLTVTYTAQSTGIGISLLLFSFITSSSLNINPKGGYD